MLVSILALLAVSSDVVAACGRYADVVDSVKDKRNYAAAERCLRLSLARRLMDARSTDREIAIDLSNLAAIAQLRGRVAEADALYHRALEISRRDGRYESLLLANAATFYHAQGNLELADSLYRKLETGDRRPQWLEQHAALLRKMEFYADAARLDTQALGMRVRKALQAGR